MRIAYQWLKDYLPALPPAEEVAHLLTHAGLEVESVHTYSSVKGTLEGVVIGKVLECTQHPNADKLKCTRVDVGQSEPLLIVCGAANVAVGQTVVVALPGAILYPTENNPITIQMTSIRGVASQGMLCAEDELGIGSSHDGIMVLSNHWKIGTPAYEVFPIYRDEVFEIGLTPNRGDAASHYGVAVDLGALLQQPLQHAPNANNIPSLPPVEQPVPIHVHIDNPEQCTRYTGVVIGNIASKPTPDWLVNRLQSVGVPSINLIVDITNYVMLDTGQPLHAFDYDALAGHSIRVGAPHLDTLRTLDGVDRTLDKNDLLINDAERPICLAGVFGGKSSGITPDTRRIFLESACFSPTSVRKSALHHGLKTDASFRFERGTDPELPIPALYKAIDLLDTHAGGFCISEVIDLYPGRKAPLVLEIRLSKISRLLGIAIPTSEVKRILLSLGFDLNAQSEDQWQVTVPHRRSDIHTDADIAEELLRVYGFDKVPLSESLGTKFFASHDVERRSHKKLAISTMLSARGHLEIMTNSLTSVQSIEKLNPSLLPELVRIMNPLSENLNTLRPELLPAMIESALYNLNRQQKHFKFFEFGKYYRLSEPQGYKEEEVLGILVTGSEYHDHWEHAAQPLGYFSLLQVLRDCLRLLHGASPTIAYQSGFSLLDKPASLNINNVSVGYIGKVSRSTIKYFDVKQDIWYGQLYISKVFENQLTPPSIQEPDRFPSVRRDLSLLLDQSIHFETVEAIARVVLKDFFKEIRLFDVFQGAQIGEGKLSYSVAFILAAKERTLTDQEIEQAIHTLIKAFETGLSAVIRR